MAKPTRPIKILQFGEGNFLRAYFDWMVQLMNDTTNFNGLVRIVQPRSDILSASSVALNMRGGFYHVALRGVEDGRVIDRICEVHSVTDVLRPESDWQEIEHTACDSNLRFVVSNTTEAGIVYLKGENTFPFKIAKMLKARFAAKLSGLVFLPCELIENNGGELRRCVLEYARKDLGDEDLSLWIEKECIFCSTLVDRIVSGRAQGDSALCYERQIGERDEALVCAEPFHFLAVELPMIVSDGVSHRYDLESELPLKAAGVNVVYTDNLVPYRTRKVRFLNGAHTASVLAGRLAGFEFVDELVRDGRFNSYLRQILFDEIFVTVDLPDEAKRMYAESVLERFTNPYAHHRLLSIALNSVSKWKVRVLPSILDYLKIRGTLPLGLVKSFASLIEFYRTDEINDDVAVLEFFRTKPSPREIMRKREFWGMDLTQVPGFAAAVEAEVHI